MTDRNGKILKFQLTGGQTADCTKAKDLLKGQKADFVLADKGYDTDAIVCFIKRTMKATVVIPPKRNRNVQRRYDKHIYKERNFIERAFNKLKHWRRVATRYDRCDAMFIASISLACLSIGA